jgi:hypothetical protein
MFSRAIDIGGGWPGGGWVDSMERKNSDGVFFFSSSV